MIVKFDDMKVEQGMEAGSVNQTLLIATVKGWPMFQIEVML